MESRSERERRIFEDCLDLPEDQRPAHLRSACEGDEALEERVLRLLAAHERAQAHTSRLGGARPAPRVPERIGPFRVLERLGEGGMGVVYAAEQSEPIRRRVALKLVKVGLDSREVLGRFDSERQALALMGHPNIARMLDAGTADDGRPYFVMEYVPGVPITEYCDQRQLGIRDRLALFLDVCAAVQHAHQKGVIHRDIKPSNILVAEEGGRPVPKIIDFGVAKALNQRLTDVTVHTEVGRMIGTPEYMSPEQVEMSALDVDTRADIYSLGVLLYELLTGSRPFEFQGGDRGYEQIRRVILEEMPEAPGDRIGRLVELVPAVALRRGATPAALERTVRGELDWIAMTALAKDRRRRYQTAGELAEEVQRYLDDRPLRASPARTLYRARKFVARHRGPMVAASLVLLALAAGAALASLGALRRLGETLLAEPPVLRTVVAVGQEETLWLGSTRSVAISPDGRRLAYIGQVDGDTRLFLRQLDEWWPRQVRGSDGARTPFFSPDGAWVGFFAQGELRKVAADGARLPDTVAEIGVMPRGASWGAGDRIAYSLGTAGIHAVPASGGASLQLTEPDRETGELEHQWPQWLPGGEALLFTATRADAGGVVEQLGIRTPDGVQRRLLGRGGQAAWVPTGHLVYVNDGLLEAAPFDPGSLEITGPSVTVLEDLRSYPAGTAVGAAYYDVSASGTLLYVPPAVTDPVTVEWVDREGRLEPLGDLPGVPGWPRISPDGRRVALHVAGPDNREVWIVDLDRPGSLRQLTSLGGGFPTWSADGRHIALMSRRGGSSDIWIAAADGSEEPRRVVAGAATQIPVSWSRDGILAYYEVAGTTQRDLYTVEPGAGSSQPFVVSPANELAPVFSPDGRHIAYVSNETGRNEVYVRPYPPPGPVTVVSIDGGSEPVWSRDGTLLYYRHDDTIMAVEVETGGAFRAAPPRPVLEAEMVDGAGGNPSYDVDDGGERFLMLRSGNARDDRLHLVVNWAVELARLVESGGRR